MKSKGIPNRLIDCADKFKNVELSFLETLKISLVLHYVFVDIILLMV